MTAPFVDVRVRRPQAHEQLIHDMRTDAAFPRIADALLFAAAVGVRQNRKSDFTQAGEAIRYETLTVPAFSDALVAMIAANEIDDPEILDSARIQERIGIFERYANGGLEYIQELVNTRSQPVELIVADLVTEALSEGSHVAPASIEDLLGSGSW
ncbi:DNA phosphorothioation-associated protein 4 [Rhodococcus hoagii]|nr:DNA phosphorothioation-associated protein 4 [Prescottella equi]